MEFYTDSNATKHFPTRAELTELWGFLFNCHKTNIVHIVITCDVLIQSEHVNMILKYREYCATSTVTEPVWRHCTHDDVHCDICQLTQKKWEKPFVVLTVFLLAIGLKTNTRTLWTQQLGFFFTSYAPVAEWFAQIGGLETPAKSGMFKWTNFIEIGKAHDKILSLELDQVHSTLQLCYIQLISTHCLDISYLHHFRFCNLRGSQRLPHLSQHCHSQIWCRNQRHQMHMYALRLTGWITAVY